MDGLALRRAKRLHMGMLTIRRDIIDSILAHARADHPNMACGLVAGLFESDRPERFIPMANALRSPSAWQFDPVEQLKVWMEMDEREEDPVVIYYSQSTAGTNPSRTSIASAVEPLAHYVIVSTFRPDDLEFRSYRIRDGQALEEAVTIVGS
jgi:[CysO sulfur-carrier protein]-S-L-cysteine hydrolase